jgi:ketosteroid isomerase-like protein
LSKPSPFEARKSAHLRVTATGKRVIPGMNAIAFTREARAVFGEPRRMGREYGGRKNLNATAMLKKFCDAVEQHNGADFADLFTEDGVYHDVFYGAFAGRAKIAEMIDDWFYRTATDFRWDMHSPVSDGETLYARYAFSYRSILPEAKGARAMFEGVAIMKLRGGLIAEYHEVANTATGFVDMNFAPERIAKIVAKQGAALKARPEMKRHLAE